MNEIMNEIIIRKLTVKHTEGGKEIETYYSRSDISLKKEMGILLHTIDYSDVLRATLIYNHEKDRLSCRIKAGVDGPIIPIVFNFFTNKHRSTQNGQLTQKPFTFVKGWSASLELPGI